MEKRDYYEVLGVSKSADEKELKSAYRKLAKKYHPDVAKEENAEELYKEVQEAYGVLSDTDKRAAYDRYGHAAFQNGTGASAGQGGFGGFDMDINDIFDMFGGFGGGRSRNRQSQGQDIQRQMTITFKESVFGVAKSIEVDAYEECSHCHGTGGETPSDVQTCKTCGGHGQVQMQQQSIFGTTTRVATCPDCQGKGKTYTKACHVCKGEGVERKRKTLEIKLPAGVESGDVKRIPGYGGKGSLGGANGDLYVVVQVEEDAYFKREGDHIIIEIPISYTQAALGSSIEVPTIHGPVNLKIPAGTQSGTTFRLAKKGIHFSNGRSSDQYVIANISTPKNVSKEEKELLKKLDELNGHVGHEVETIFDKVKGFFKK